MVLNYYARNYSESLAPACCNHWFYQPFLHVTKIQLFSDIAKHFANYFHTKTKKLTKCQTPCEQKILGEQEQKLFWLTKVTLDSVIYHGYIRQMLTSCNDVNIISFSTSFNGQDCQINALHMMLRDIAVKHMGK